MVWLLAAGCTHTEPKDHDPATTHGSTDSTDTQTTDTVPTDSGTTETGGSGTPSTPAITTCDETPGPAIGGDDDPGTSFDYGFGSARVRITLILDETGTAIGLCDPVEGELHSTVDIFFATRGWDDDLSDTASYCEQRFVIDGTSTTQGTSPDRWIQLAVPAHVPAAYDSCWGNLGTNQTGTTSGLSMLAAFGGLQLGMGPLPSSVADEITASGGDPTGLVGGWFFANPDYATVYEPDRVSGIGEQLDPAGDAIDRDSAGAPVPWDPASVPTATGVQPGRYTLWWLDDWRVSI